jgi:hypothetical protein
LADDLALEDLDFPVGAALDLGADPALDLGVDFAGLGGTRPASTLWAAARRAMGTRKGEQLT